ncbi:MAG: hypothetical protein Q9160_008309 [Pyrenula sp. 1 TL-2023]
MFEWYHQSTVCYVYLQDVTTAAVPRTSGPRSKHSRFQPSPKQSIREQKQGVKRKYDESDKPYGFPRDEAVQTTFHPLQFQESRWFTRGWTLQELIAPKYVEFYTAEWFDIGTKASLPAQISAVTRVPVHVLRGESPTTCTIAERMSWASERQTTREEDKAYSLLGLFGINMPLIYGEGKRSFMRLQEEILKQEEDYSIFAWSLRYDCEDAVTGLLASSPAEFSQRGPSRMVFPNFASGIRGGQGGDQEYRNDKEKGQRLFEHDFSTLGIQPWYRIMHQKDYRRLRCCTKNGNLAGTSESISHTKENATEDLLQRLEPREPPSLTSRGLKISLPVRSSTNPNIPSTAWLYCRIGLRLVCILLDSKHSAQLSYRYAAPWLVTVSADLLQEFTLKELHAFPSGFLNQSEKHSLSVPPTLTEKHWGRIKIETLDTADSVSSNVISVYPYKKWALDELFFDEQPSVAGAVLIETSHHTNNIRFAVLTGFNGHLPFCHCETMHLPVTEKSLECLFDWSIHPQSGFMARIGRRSDRCAIVTDSSLVLTARLRQQPTRGKQITAYVLRIAVYDARQPVHAIPDWITLRMSDLELQAEKGDLIPSSSI